MKIGDLFLALGVDSADFKAVVTKEAEAAGKAGSSKFSSTFATGLKVGSVIVGAAFGLMAKGAIEMEKSQGKFQAATGRSREEAIEFSKAMNGIVGSAKTVGASFEEISDTGIAVSQQFDITGQKATDLTEDILGFAKVTGQDASDAALQLEDTLSAFGLSADDASGFMDQLVASSQKFGTDAGPATLSILQGMAPALQAMGEDLDAGVGLLNLFETAGLDAAKAPAALNKAIATLKPGQSLDDLITQISSIEDPTLRAQEAMKIFGARSGVGLANAMQPGIDSLDDFIPTIEEAAGASDRAAEDMLTTSDKIRMFTEKAGGFLRGLGQDFGPVVTGLASLASLSAPFAKGIVGLFTGLLRHVGILAAATAVGTATGGAQAAGHEVAATGPGAIKSLAARIAAMSIPLAGAGTTVGTAVGGAMAAGVTAGWLVAIGAGAGAAIFGPRLLLEKLTGNDEEGKLRGQTLAYAVSEGFSAAAGAGAGDAMVAAVVAAVASGATREEAYAAGEAAAIAFLNGWVEPWAGGADNTSGRDAFDRYMADLANIAAQGGTEAGTAIGEGVAGSISQWAPTIGLSIREHMDILGFRELGAGIPGQIGEGMQSTANQVLDAASGLRELLKTGLSPEARAMEIIGGNYVKLVRQGMTSGIDGARETAIQVAAAAINTIEDAGLGGKKGAKGLKQIGELYTTLLANGMTAAEARATLAASDVSDATITELEKTAGPAGTAGSDAITAYRTGITGLIGGVTWGGFNPNLRDNRTVAGAAGQARGAVVTTLSNTSGFAGYGSNTTGEYASGIDSPAAKKKATDAARNVLNAVRAVFFTESPPKDPILHDIGKWGQNAIEEYARGLLGGVDAVKDAAATVASQLTELGRPVRLPFLERGRMDLDMPILKAGGTLELHHTVDIRGDSGNLDNRKVADMLNDGASGFAWNLEHAMSAVTSG